MSRLYSWLMPVAVAAVASGALALPAQAQLVQNGTFTALTNFPNPSEIGVNNAAVTYWNGNGGYNFLFFPNTADSTGANQGSGYTANCYYGTGCGSNLYLWGPNTGGIGLGPNNGFPATVPGGRNFIAMDGDYNTKPLTQSISGLSVGTVYAVSFYYAFAQQAGYSGATTQNLFVNLGNPYAKSVGAYNLGSKGFSGWNSDTLYFEASSATETLSFLAYGNVQLPPFALITDISMQAAPEPATWATMAVGIVGLIGAARLRRARRSTDVATPV